MSERVKIPMKPGRRSLNLANSASIAVFEAWRQNGFEEAPSNMTATHHNLPSIWFSILETDPPWLSRFVWIGRIGVYGTGLGAGLSASPHARIVVIGQAPGRAAQESRIPWNDQSGVKLREWMGITDEQFYNPELISLPMDFTTPARGTR